MLHWSSHLQHQQLTFGNSVQLISLHKLSSHFHIHNIHNDTVKLSTTVQSSRHHRYSAPTVWLAATFKSENILLTSSGNAIACRKANINTLLKIHWLCKFCNSEFQGKTALTTYLTWGQLIIFHGMTFPPFSGSVGGTTAYWPLINILTGNSWIVSVTHVVLNLISCTVHSFCTPGTVMLFLTSDKGQ